MKIVKTTMRNPVQFRRCHGIAISPTDLNEHGTTDNVPIHNFKNTPSAWRGGLEGGEIQHGSEEG
jgi:hypothetical protein